MSQPGELRSPECLICWVKEQQVMFFGKKFQIIIDSTTPGHKRTCCSYLKKRFGQDGYCLVFLVEQVEPVAEELTLAFKERKGHCIPVIGAYEVLVELKKRGYLLGMVSNTISSLDIPRSLESFGWNELFHTVILSSAVKVRKPSPEIFWEATRSMNIDPIHCAYLGNRISRDMVGCKRAGFALGILIESQGKPHPGEKAQKTQPDVIISSLSELLALFPGRI